MNRRVEKARIDGDCDRMGVSTKIDGRSSGLLQWQCAITWYIVQGISMYIPIATRLYALKSASGATMTRVNKVSTIANTYSGFHLLLFCCFFAFVFPTFFCAPSPHTAPLILWSVLRVVFPTPIFFRRLPWKNTTLPHNSSACVMFRLYFPSTFLLCVFFTVLIPEEKPDHAPFCPGSVVLPEDLRHILILILSYSRLFLFCPKNGTYLCVFPHRRRGQGLNV